jgi:hypothetical protein
MNRKKLFTMLVSIAIMVLVITIPAFAEGTTGEEHQSKVSCQSISGAPDCSHIG